MSKGVCLYTTVAAVKAADKILGPHEWSPVNATQKSWLRDTYEPISDELPKIPEIVSNATWEIANHVAFMKKYGWEAMIKALKPNEFATAGILDLLVSWVEKGEKAPVRTADGKTYPGVKLDNHCAFFTTPAHDQPVARLQTKSGDVVWLTMLDAAPDGLALADLAEKVFRSAATPAYYEGVLFPMVDLYFKHSHDWLVGLNTESEMGGAEIAEALQQIKLKMNDEGARAQAADECRVTVTCVREPPPMLVIDKPFLVSFERPGLAKPLFVAHVTQEDWKYPGGLG